MQLDHYSPKIVSVWLSFILNFSDFYPSQILKNVVVWGDFVQSQKIPTNYKVCCQRRVVLCFELPAVYTWSRDYHFYCQNFISCLMWHQFWLLECGSLQLPYKCGLIPCEWRTKIKQIIEQYSASLLAMWFTFSCFFCLFRSFELLLFIDFVLFVKVAGVLICIRKLEV